MKNNRFKSLLRNMYHILSGKICQRLDTLQQEINNQKELINKIKKDELLNYINTIKFQIMYYYKDNAESEQYKDEIEYVKNNAIFVFPYDQKESNYDIIADLDKDKNLPYVIHKQKKLYFPSTFTIETVKAIYRDYIENEGLLGNGLRRKSPHQYESKSFFLEKNDILLDLGCAEALFSLDKVELATKIFLIESNPMWLDPLKATFEPWKDKVIIIDKFITNKVSKNTTTLQDILNNESDDNLFIKMDIEGNELDVLKSSLDFLSKKRNVKIATCTYHRANDFEDISNLLKKHEYSLEVSDGYMVFVHDRNLTYPFFRHGLIRAVKQ